MPELIHDATTILEAQQRHFPGLDVDEAIETILWDEVRHYRVSVSTSDMHAKDAARKKLFKGFETVAPGKSGAAGRTQCTSTTCAGGWRSSASAPSPRSKRGGTMFDPITVELIARAPPLASLDLDELPKRFTNAYAEIVAARVRMRGLVGTDSRTEALATLLDEIAGWRPRKRRSSRAIRSARRAQLLPSLLVRPTSCA